MLLPLGNGQHLHLESGAVIAANADGSLTIAYPAHSVTIPAAYVLIAMQRMGIAVPPAIIAINPDSMPGSIWTGERNGM